MEITSANLDNGPNTPQLKRNLVRVKFEVVPPQGFEQPKKKGSLVGKFLQLMGGFSGLGWIFGGPAAGLGMAGAGALGTQMDARARASEAGPPPVKTISYPGLDPSASYASDPALDLVASSRDAALYLSTREVKR